MVNIYSCNVVNTRASKLSLKIPLWFIATTYVIYILVDNLRWSPSVPSSSFILKTRFRQVKNKIWTILIKLNLIMFSDLSTWIFSNCLCIKSILNRLYKNDCWNLCGFWTKSELNDKLKLNDSKTIYDDAPWCVQRHWI